MDFIIGLMIILGIPVIAWYLLGLLFGVKDFYPTSIWTYLCELLSVYTILVWIYLARKKKIERTLRMGLAFAASLIALVFSLIYLGKGIASAGDYQQRYIQWKDTILATCRSFPVDPSPVPGSLASVDQVWNMTAGKFDDITSELQNFLRTYRTPAEWENTLRVVAIIDETYQVTGSYYVDSVLSNSPTGLRAVRYTWDVTICDRDNQRLFEKVFDGPEPPEKLTTSETAGDVGIRPTADYQAWVALLVGK